MLFYLIVLKLLDKLKTLFPGYDFDLNENEWNASINASWDWGEKNKLIFGFNMKNKERLYTATRFYYNLNKLNPEIDDIYHADNYLNFDNIVLLNYLIDSLELTTGLNNIGIYQTTKIIKVLLSTFLNNKELVFTSTSVLPYSETIAFSTFPPSR